MGRKMRLAQSSLIAGELSPLMVARSDKPYNRNGAAAMKNMAPLAQGGARTRPGLVYLETLAYTPARLADFMFNLDQRYVFAFSDARVDIYSPAGAAVTALTSAPWTKAMVTGGRLNTEVSGDTMIVTHLDLETQVIKRTGASTFTRADFTFETNSADTITYQPYHKYAPATMTLTPGATTGTGVSLTLSAPGAWTAAHVGAIIRHKSKEILITGYTSATVATGTVRDTLTDTSAATDWDEATFSAARGWPVSAAFFLNRLWFFGSKSFPRGVWASKAGAFFNFDLGSSEGADAIWDAVDYGEVRYGIGAGRLLIFTDRGFFYIPHSSASPLTADNYEFRPQEPYGIALVTPRIFDGAALFVQSTGAVVREARWNDVEQGFNAPTLSLLASHLISSPTAMATLHGSALRPEQYALFINGDGNLSVFHSIREQEVAGWAPWITAGTVKSICACGEETFVAVERTLDETTVWTLEKFDDTAAPLDCSLSDTISPAGKTFNGFTHLANEEVSVYSNGHYLGEHTVSAGGEIVLDDLAPDVLTIEAGFAFEQRVKPMPAVLDLPEGESRGLVLGVTRTMIQVDRSAAFAIDGSEILLEFAGDDYASAATTATGILEVYHLGVDKDGQKEIVITAPAKVTILGITREVEMGG